MLSAVILLAGLLLTEAPDTLQTATVSAARGITVSREDTLSIRNTNTVTELLIQSPSLVASDNGGNAGLKSISLRGLGSPHTIIYIDGIKVGNVQSGQTDLGMINLENTGGVIIDYAQNSLNFKTERPHFNGKNVTGKFRFNGGSFGTYLPYGRLDFKLSDRVSLSANAGGNFSKGDYPYGEGLLRTNNDIKQIKAGIDLFGFIERGEWSAKAYYNKAGRGTPGSTDWPSTDRQRDNNIFVQGMLHKSISHLYTMNIAGKVSRDDIQYLSEWGDSDYGQTEIQLNTAHKFKIRHWLEMSAVTEMQWDKLQSTLYDASRTGLTAVAGVAFTPKDFRADFTLQYGGTFDKGGNSHNVISPAVDVRYSASKNLDIIGFVRRAYRTPTFNELYYPGYGNPELKPEDALLTDIGLDFRKNAGSRSVFKAKIDGFYNLLDNKITSAPNPDNPSLWLPYNIGTVRASGIDAEIKMNSKYGEWALEHNLKYSFQYAENVPYLSKNTLLISENISFKKWTMDILWNYRGGRKDSYGSMPDWNTLDLILCKEFTLRGTGPLMLRVAARNITGCRYELVSGYPMPGFSLTGGIEITI